MFLGLLPGVHGGGIFDDWNGRMKVTFPLDLSATLTNFPALLVLNTNTPGFRYADFKAADGKADLRFTASDEITELNYEVEKWDTNGDSFVWVQVPELSGE